jgi:hypothetical protein
VGNNNNANHSSPYNQIKIKGRVGFQTLSPQIHIKTQPNLR